MSDELQFVVRLAIQDFDKLKGTSEQVQSTRSVAMNLARPFKAGKGQRGICVA